MEKVSKHDVTIEMGDLTPKLEVLTLELKE